MEEKSRKQLGKDLLPNRTHIQIASHAQKYFMFKRLAAGKNRKKPSIFDVHLEE